MAVMIAGTQSRRLILIPVLSLVLAALDYMLQSHGLSIWVRPLGVSVLLAILLLNPGGLVSEIRRAEERVAESVDEGVRVGMPPEPERMADAHAPKDERPPRHEGMDVIADADSI